jgi:hypothetical protein
MARAGLTVSYDSLASLARILPPYVPHWHIGTAPTVQAGFISSLGIHTCRSVTSSATRSTRAARMKGAAVKYAVETGGKGGPEGISSTTCPSETVPMS